MAVQVLGDGNPEGSTVGSSATELAGFHGLAVAQAAAIATSASTLVSLKAKLNLLLVAARAKGIIASA
jgi:hypothetical protein